MVHCVYIVYIQGNFPQPTRAQCLTGANAKINCGQKLRDMVGKNSRPTITVVHNPGIPQTTQWLAYNPDDVPKT